MSSCSIDHTPEQVKEKLESQRGFMPEDVSQKADSLLTEELSQERLNELFHLLKKYDLAAPEEQSERNKAIINLAV
ncbi:group-specific protein [Sinobaca sp. H24]|uniref:group-specific protein n=1 Tax=Sinobaca sp. H24 TaxID=2923376 RepID=UPI002079AAA4|nr:group-specific protein [Sinobaca sp. H24]